MTCTYTQAVDAMFTLFNIAWLAGAGAVVSPVPEIRWQGVEKADPPSGVYWCRVSTKNVDERQATLEGVGLRRYTADGLLFVQLFAPRSDDRAMERGRTLAMIARNAFRGKTTDNGVWFRNARINELPAQSDAYCFNIVVEYQYDEMA